MSQKVILAGGGPGDLSLVTLGLVEHLKKAEVVLYDELINKSLLRYCPDDAEIIHVGKTGQGRESRKTKQKEINELMTKFIKEGKSVLRLKGGDPFIFGRGSEECEFLEENNIPFEVLPGVSSAQAVPTYAGIPLTHRELSRSVSFATGHLMEGASQDEIVIPKTDTIVFLMGVKNLEVLVKKLIQEGHPENKPCALVENGTTSKQRVFTGTLKEIVSIRDEHQIKPPTLFIVGEVVTLRDKVSWFEKGELFGLNIVVTRSKSQSSDISEKLRALGAGIFECPTIEIQKDKNALENLETVFSDDRFTDVVFTSENSVRFFFETLLEFGMDTRILAHKNILAVGPKTSRTLASFGIQPDLVAKKFQAEGLLEILDKNLSGRSFLFPKAKKTRKVLREGIEARGGEVEELILYETLAPQKPLPLPDSIDGICFTSSSTASNFSTLYSCDKGIPSFVLGEITAETAKQNGFSNVITAGEATISSLVETIIQHFPKNNRS